MTDTPPDVAPEQSQEATQHGLRVLAQFVRDLSFENPNAPASLRNGGAQPGIDMNVELSARAREDGLFEVDLKLSAKAARPEETVFVVELVYGGVFQIEGVGPDELEPVLLEAARAHGVDARFFTEFGSLTQDAEGVNGVLVHRETGDRTEVRADYLIAADGARSPLRAALEVPQQGGPVLSHQLNLYFRAELGHRMKLYSVPQLHFAYDDSIESGMRLSQLIDDAVASDRKPPR